MQYTHSFQKYKGYSEAIEVDFGRILGCEQVDVYFTVRWTSNHEFGGRVCVSSSGESISEKKSMLLRRTEFELAIFSPFQFIGNLND